MLRLLQTDPRWANETIGNTQLKIGRWGCTITSVAMALSYFNNYIRPSKLARVLSFTKEGLLIWSSLKNVHLSLSQRFYSWNTSIINQALKNPKTVCLLQVPLGRAYHWVVAVGKVPFTDHYFIADPLNKNILRTTMSYGKITGGAVVSRVEAV